MRHIWPRHKRSALLAALMAAGVAGLLLHTAWLAGFGRGSIDNLANNWVYNGVLVAAALVCLVRGISSRQDRGPWLFFGLGLSLWAAGDIYWTAVLMDVRHAPYPSWADVLYLAEYPCLYVGILLLVSRRVELRASNWLDGMIGGLAAAALATALLAPALVGATKGDPAVVATNLAYPLGDVLLLSFLVTGVIVGGAGVGRNWILIALGLMTLAVADGIYLYQEATSTYAGGYLDSLWLLSFLFIAAAALVRSESHVTRSEHRPMMFPVLFASIALGILLWDQLESVGGLSTALAVATLAVVVARLMLSFRENTLLLRTVQVEAVSDPLTGLANRRSMMRDLERALENQETVAVLALFDLDGFKNYNDTYGHPAGDLLLRRLGAALREAVSPHGKAYRLGGDEFCVLTEGEIERGHRIVEEAGSALREEGEGFLITASVGSVVLGVETTDVSEALRLADTRMYAAKGLRPDSAKSQAQEMLLRILRERAPDLREHLGGVTALAVTMARRLRLGAEDLDALARAAELHDVGKLAIPDRILNKASRLDPDEWELMKSHTVIGARILGAAPAMKPVADLVRSSHERWDGEGYPDRLAGEEIPLGSRIIFICDAFEAITSDRAYRPAKTPDWAIRELRRCAGTQFDPRLVEIFCAEVGPDAAPGRNGHDGSDPVESSLRTIRRVT